LLNAHIINGPECPVTHLVRQSTFERESAHLLRHVLVIRPRCRTEDNTTTAQEWRLGAPASRSTGSLLSEELPRTASDLTTGLGRGITLTPVRELPGHRLVYNRISERHIEDTVFQLDLFDNFTLQVMDRYLHVTHQPSQ
jgi:hypothetical protein